jgi:hypothetical protein
MLVLHFLKAMPEIPCLELYPSRECHLKILLDCQKLKENPCLMMSMSTKCQLMSYNMMIGYYIYDCFTMEHFPFHQSMILTSFFFTRRNCHITQMIHWFLKVNQN